MSQSKTLAPGQRGPKPVVTFANQVKAARFTRHRRIIPTGHPMRDRLDRHVTRILRGEVAS